MTKPKKNKTGTRELIIRTEYENRSLPLKFTDAELKAMSNELVNAILARNDAELEKKDAMKFHQEKAMGLDRTINTLFVRIKAGVEYREIECGMTYDFDGDFLTVVRTDTGEVLEVVKIPENKRQMELVGEDDS